MIQQKIVITGGPSSGKTTLIHELEKRGYSCVQEISRQITQKAQQEGIDQLFTSDPLLFSKLLLEGRVQQFIDANTWNATPIFFDRGIPEIHAYMDFFKTKYPIIYKEKSQKHRYDLIFLLPPWEEIHTTDKERYEDYELAVEIYEYIKNTYHELGYQTIEVPIGTIKERTDYILEQILV